jgi:hypothetical protein
MVRKPKSGCRLDCGRKLRSLQIKLDSTRAHPQLISAVYTFRTLAGDFWSCCFSLLRALGALCVVSRTVNGKHVTFAGMQ